MGKNQDPGSGINIPDPQHCKLEMEVCIAEKGPFFLSFPHPSCCSVIVKFPPIGAEVRESGLRKSDMSPVQGGKPSTPLLPGTAEVRFLKGHPNCQ